MNPAVAIQEIIMKKNIMMPPIALLCVPPVMNGLSILVNNRRALAFHFNSINATTITKTKAQQIDVNITNIGE